jgi:hypothetical protein
MAIAVNVRGNMNRVIAEAQRNTRDVRSVAVPRALNKMIDQVKTGSSRAIRDKGYKLKVSTIKKSLKITRATAGSLTARVTASGRPIPLQEYSARQTAKGVSVDVLNGRKVVAHAFIATMPSGHKAVLVRMGKTHKKTRRGDRAMWSGLPVKQLFGPSVPDGMANAEVQEALQRLVLEKFPTILRQQIDRLK